MIFVIKVTTNKEESAVDLIADRIKKKNLNIIFCFKTSWIKRIYPS